MKVCHSICHLTLFLLGRVNTRLKFVWAWHVMNLIVAPTNGPKIYMILMVVDGEAIGWFGL